MLYKATSNITEDGTILSNTPHCTNITVWCRWEGHYMPDMQQVPNPSGSEKLELSSFCEGVTPKSSDRYFLTSIL